VPVNGEHKILGRHRSRAALVYLRQSTLVQVRQNTESTLRQYALADAAVRLGWAAADVEVIDTDLGLSGTSAAHREGYRTWSRGSASARSGRCSGWRCPGWPAPTPTWPSWRSWPG
jgi:hypothetical protein